METRSTKPKITASRPEEKPGGVESSKTPPSKEIDIEPIEKTPESKSSGGEIPEPIGLNPTGILPKPGKENTVGDAALSKKQISSIRAQKSAKTRAENKAAGIPSKAELRRRLENERNKNKLPEEPSRKRRKKKSMKEWSFIDFLEETE